MKKKLRLMAAAVIFIILSFSIVVLLYSLNSVIPHISVNIKNGATDLTDFDFSSSIAYVPEAEFYSGRLLSPDELENAVSDSPVFDRTAKYNTARVRFLVPDGDYMIFGLSPEYASNIYINGKLAETVGRIDETNDENNIYRVAPFSIAAQPIDGVIELVAQSAGIIRDDPYYYGFNIGSYNVAKYRLLLDTAYRMIPVVISAMCALFYIGYFLFIPSVKVNLWFALIAFVTGFFLSGSGGFAYSFFPALDYQFEFYGANICLIMICVLYSLFAQALYGISKAVPIAVCVSGAVLSVLNFSIPINIAAKYLVIHMGFVFIVQIVCIACILSKIRQFNPEHIISFCGQIIFMLCGVFDLLGTTDLMPFLGLTPMGILMFTFAQMTALYLVNNRAAENERRLEAENISLEKLNRMKTELLGNISHELKTPLTVISNVSQLAARHTSESYVKEKMETAVTEVERMKIKVGQLLKLSRIEDAEMRWDFQPVNISHVIADTVSAYFQTLDEHDNTLSVELPDELSGVKVKADAEHLTGVIVNLIDNATRFTRNGKITVKAEHNKDCVTVSVNDTGCGMSTEHTAHIFERFYTGGKSTGTGLGLSICKKIIDAHNGEIRVQSEENIGTTISFTLPLYEEEDIL